jgi:quercetin dioxygenase-like cupin family protein
MRNVLAFGAASLVMVAAVGAQSSATAHVLLPATDIKWGAAPPVFEKGASFAVLSGDPGKPGPFTVRLKLPAGFKIAPHWHPTDEHVTVIAGTFALGMGEKFDAAAAKDLAAGGYAVMPSEMRHFAVARTAATVQVNGMGPFVLNYVNPADDPSKRIAPATAK